MSYRSDTDALRLQLSQLEDELSVIREDRARVEAGLAREPRIVTELDRLRRELHARAPRSLPILDDIRVASPCHERWDAMTGDEQVRHCARCDKNVFNLSAMTREAAEHLVREKEAKLCVRYFRRADGTILTADCPVGVRRKRVALVAAAGTAAALATAAFATLTARMGEPAQPDVAPVAGRVALPIATSPLPYPAPFNGPVSANPGSETVQGQMEMGDMPAPTPRSEPTNRPRMGRPIMHRAR